MPKHAIRECAGEYKLEVDRLLNRLRTDFGLRLVLPKHPDRAIDRGECKQKEEWEGEQPSHRAAPVESSKGSGEERWYASPNPIAGLVLVVDPFAPLMDNSEPCVCLRKA